MWSSDNAIFNVNGEGVDKLKSVLELAAGKTGTFYGYKVDLKKGIVLYSYKSGEDVTKFPSPIKPNQAAEIVFGWLQTDEAKKIPCEGWDADADHDGSNEIGWRAYTEEWGHVNGDWNCIAIKPAWMWYGK